MWPQHECQADGKCSDILTVELKHMYITSPLHSTAAISSFVQLGFYKKNITTTNKMTFFRFHAYFPPEAQGIISLGIFWVTSDNYLEVFTSSI